MSVAYFSVQKNPRELTRETSLEKFYSKILLNQLFDVSIVKFNSTENNSDSDVNFSRTKTLVAASFSC